MVGCVRCEVIGWDVMIVGIVLMQVSSPKGVIELRKCVQRAEEGAITPTTRIVA